MKRQLTIYSKYLLYFGIFSFCFNTIFRRSVASYFGIYHNFFVNYNFIAIFFFILSFTNSKGKGKKCIWTKCSILCTLIFTIIAIISNMGEYRSDNAYFILFLSVLPGFLLINYNQNNRIDYLNILRKFTLAYNYIFIPIFALGIIDYFIGGKINLFLAHEMSSPEWAQVILGDGLSNGFRMCTIMGSPLMNGYYGIVLLAINALYKRYIGDYLLNKYFLYIFTAIVIILTGSRTAILCAAAFIFLNEAIGKMSILKITVVLIIGLLFIESNIFEDTIGQRFEKLGDSDVRYTLWENFINGNFGVIEIFKGGGYGFSRWLTQDSVITRNFEYPWLMIAFDYGLLGLLLYYAILFIIPFSYLLHKKEYYLVLVYLPVCLVLQTCNIIAEGYDFILQLSFIVSIIVNIQPKKE